MVDYRRRFCALVADDYRSARTSVAWPGVRLGMTFVSSEGSRSRVGWTFMPGQVTDARSSA